MNLLDYLSWRGDLSFAQVPFSPVDGAPKSQIGRTVPQQHGQRGELGLLLGDKAVDISAQLQSGEPGRAGQGPKQPQVTVVDSDQRGLFQHDPYSWQIMGPDFVQLEEGPSAAMM